MYCFDKVVTRTRGREEFMSNRGGPFVRSPGAGLTLSRLAEQGSGLKEAVAGSHVPLRGRPYHRSNPT